MQQSKFIRDIAVAEHFGVSRATIWRWAQRPDFPQPVKLSPGCSRWRLEDIQAWSAPRNNGAQ